MKPKKCLTKQQQVEYWTQKYLEAKTGGNTKLMKLYESVINKLGGKVSRL
jgi:hypothetical protein